MTHIAVDAMGGDHAPSAIVDGAAAAARHLDIQISLVGPCAAIEPALERHAEARRLAIQARLGEKLSRVFDYAEYDGARLLGVAGLVVVGHGRSSAKAVSNGIAMGHRFATGDFIQRVEQEIAAAGVSHN
jgi:fatty acid/phospholipid biosynthesis enzyme